MTERSLNKETQDRKMYDRRITKQRDIGQESGSTSTFKLENL